jgi:hypothetical protein
MSAAKRQWTERIEVIQGDITKLPVDAIVNAARSTQQPDRSFWKNAGPWAAVQQEKQRSPKATNFRRDL